MPALDAADNERRAQIERVKEAGFAAMIRQVLSQIGVCAAMFARRIANRR